MIELSVASWSAYKTLIAAKNLSIQYSETSTRYELFAIEHPGLVWKLAILKDGGADVLDWEANYQPTANQPLKQYVSSSGQKPDGTWVSENFQGVEAGNTTTTPLGSSGTYRGTWFQWQEKYSKLGISVIANVSGIIWIDFSDITSPINGDDSSVQGTVVYAYDPAINGLFREHVPVQSKWVRVRFGNNAVAQSSFSFTTILMDKDPGLVALQLRTLPVRSQLAGITRNIPAIPTFDGSSFQDIPIASDGNPKSYISHIEDDILIEPLDSASASQTVVGTTATRLDPSPLANRRVINVDNDGPVRIALGHSSGITFNTSSIRVPTGSSRSFAINPNLQVWAIAEDLGGIQSTLTRSAASASGTATSPSNSLTSNNVYSTISANGQTIDTSGYTAGTTNALVSVKLGIEGLKATASPKVVAFQEHQTGSADGATTVTTTGSVTATAGLFYIAAVSRRNTASTVTSISGIGLTWILQQSEPNSTNGVVDVWVGTGTPTISGTVTANLSVASIHSHIAVTSYSNVDLTSPIQSLQVGTGANSTPTTSALTGTANGYAYMAVFSENRTMTAGSGYILRSSQLTNDGGNSDTLSVEDKALTVTGSETPTGTLSGNGDWAAISIALTPSPQDNPIITLSYTLSGTPGATSGNVTFSIGSDVTSKVDVTADRSWVVADVPNVHVIATGLTIGGANASVDYIFLELTDTTGNTSRVSVWQGGKAVS